MRARAHPLARATTCLADHRILCLTDQERGGDGYPTSLGVIGDVACVDLLSQEPEPLQIGPGVPHRLLDVTELDTQLLPDSELSTR